MIDLLSQMEAFRPIRHEGRGDAGAETTEIIPFLRAEQIPQNRLRQVDVADAVSDPWGRFHGTPPVERFSIRFQFKSTM
jgi:hypothetical protein